MDFIAVPVLSTFSASNITTNSATSGGNVTNDGGGAVTSRGVCWATSQNPTISNSKTNDGTGSGSFTSSITGLIHGTTYYVRAYATNFAGTSYGNQIIISALAIPPTVNTISATAINSTIATTGGNVTSDGGGAVTSRGVCWGTSQNPTISNSKTTDGTGSGNYASSLTGLNPGATYYVRAYATNIAGTSYGNQITFNTPIVAFILPTVTISAVTNIQQYFARSGGNVMTDGGTPVTDRGVCFGTSQNPAIGGAHTTDGTGTGTFGSDMNNLKQFTIYYVRAYATNSVGTAYSGQLSFRTAY